jgi:outer membrane protein assembly factor BamB
VITPANAGSLTTAWTWTPPDPAAGQPSSTLFAGSVVQGGRVYVGVNDGMFYALDLATGTVDWSRNLGFQPALTCSALGVIATPTVAPDPVTGVQTVYIAAGNGLMYALNAATGKVIWKTVVIPISKTQNTYMNWSSPQISNGHIYIGLSSNCDEPLVRAGVRMYDQATGTFQATHWTMPPGAVGASVWSSVAVTATNVYATTGNPLDTTSPQGDSYAIVNLNASNLKEIGKYVVPTAQLPGDSDFGASPTMFYATLNGTKTLLIGACNKNGSFYAVNPADMTLAWSYVIDKGRGPCLGAAIWDGKRLFVAGNQTAIRGVQYLGSVRRMNPVTGTPVWATGLPNGGILASPSMDGAGVIAAATYQGTGGTNGLYLLNAADGSILGFYPSPGNSKCSGQPIFSNGYVIASCEKGLTAYTP